MAKTYTLNGPIMLEDMSGEEVTQFVAALVEAIPASAMGTAGLHISAEGVDQPEKYHVMGRDKPSLEASLAKFQEDIAKPKAAATATTVVYNLFGSVQLIHLTYEQGKGVLDAAMNNIAEDALCFAGMIVNQEQEGPAA